MKVVTLSGAVIAKNGNVTGGNTSFDSQLSHWEQAKLDKVCNRSDLHMYAVLRRLAQARHRMSELRVERTRLSRALSHRGSGSRSQQVEVRCCCSLCTGAERLNPSCVAGVST